MTQKVLCIARWDRTVGSIYWHSRYGLYFNAARRLNNLSKLDYPLRVKEDQIIDGVLRKQVQIVDSNLIVEIVKKLGWEE